MIVILEGPDLAGKTTLANRLAKLMHDPVMLKRGPPQAHPLVEYELDLVKYEGRDVICDRWHLGELVYGPILRGSSRLDGPMLEHVRMFLQSMGAIVVLMYPDLGTVMSRFAERGDDLVNSRQLIAAHRGFEKFRHSRYVSFTVKGEEDWADTIIAQARSHEAVMPHKYTHNQALRSYVGPPRPVYLLVGDERSDDGRGFPSAFVPFVPTSGHFLLQSLQDLDNFNWLGNIGLINANDDHGQGKTTHVELNTAWIELGKPNVVALGTNAHKALKDACVPHGAVPHPQFVRRFHHSAIAEYGRLIFDVSSSQEDHVKWRPTSSQ